MRNDSGAKAEWDHVFYDGKYYSYYGIAPVVLLYLPYHKLTGHYCSTNLSILLFSLVGLLFLAMAYLAFVKRWCKNVSAGNIIAGMAILFSSCGIWYSVGRTLFYEISISSGFAFVALGAYFLFSSNVLSEGKVSLVRTALASLFLGIAVLCRPTLAVYAWWQCCISCTPSPSPGMCWCRQRTALRLWQSASPGASLRAVRSPAAAGAGHHPDGVQLCPVRLAAGLRHPVLADHQRLHPFPVPHLVRADRSVELSLRPASVPAGVSVHQYAFLQAGHQRLLLQR